MWYDWVFMVLGIVLGVICMVFGVYSIISCQPVGWVVSSFATGIGFMVVCIVGVVRLTRYY